MKLLTHLYMSFSRTHEIILYLKKKRWGILLTGAATAGLYLLILSVWPKSFESSALIYNSNKNKSVVADAPGYNSLQDLNEGYTIINWVYSTQLIDHLISKFDLYTHYGIRAKEEDAYSKCFNQVTRAVSVNLTPFGALKISVRDRDRFLAAAMTNEILAQTDRLNKQKSLENRRHTIREYDFLLKEISADVTSQQDSLKKMLASLTALAGNGSSQKTQEVINNLADVAKDYERVSAEWLTLRKVHLLSLKELEEHNLPNFIIVQSALPELPESFLSLTTIGLAILFFIAGTWLAIVILLLRFRFAGYLTILSVKDSSRIYPLNDVAFKSASNKDSPEHIERMPNNN